MSSILKKNIKEKQLNDNWDKKLEDEFKTIIKVYFEKKLDESFKNFDNIAEVGNNLADLLKGSEEDIVKIITPRAVKKRASKDTLPLWEEFIKNEKMISELREIGKSIANSLRPLAGNSFSFWIMKVLNKTFEKENIDLLAVTSGKIKKEINQVFDRTNIKGKLSFKPDIDIIVVQTSKGWF